MFRHSNSKFPNPKHLTAASSVWVATATLHKENPTRQSFTAEEIRQKVRDQKLFASTERTINTHITSHCVANSNLNQSASHRKLYRVDRGLYRLYRNGDPCHKTRLCGEINPPPETLPSRYLELVTWYMNEYLIDA